MRRAFAAAARLIASIIEFSEIGAETIYIISAPDRDSDGGQLYCVSGLRFSRSLAADKAHLGPIHITVAVALVLPLPSPPLPRRSN